MQTSNDSTLAELTLAANNADWAEHWHQQQCRARGAALGCKTCDHYAAEVLRTDIALRDYFRNLKDEVA